MIINEPQQINERIFLLGRKESFVYLLDGKDEIAMLGGGTVHIIPEVLEQLNKYGIDEQKIKRIVIFHTHFDHCGIVPFFKRRWPSAIVTASSRGKDMLMKPNVIDSIEFLNTVALQQYKREHLTDKLGIKFNGIEVEFVVNDNDKIKCGDRTLEILEVPGHSSCSIAIYVPEEKAMFGSDSAGVPIGNEIFTTANSNFDLYQTNLNRLAKYDLNYYFPEHLAALTDNDAREYLPRSVEAAAKAREMMETCYKKTRDIRKSTEEITDITMKQLKNDFFPREIISMVSGQMVGYLAKKLA